MWRMVALAALSLGMACAAGSALIDFLKARQIKGPAPNPLLAWFLSGERL